MKKMTEVPIHEVFKRWASSELAVHALSVRLDGPLIESNSKKMKVAMTIDKDLILEKVDFA